MITSTTAPMIWYTVRMMKPILFIDFDGTLCFDKFWRTLPFEKYNAVQEFLFSGENQFVKEWMSGNLTSEDINKLVSEKIAMNTAELWNIFVKECESMVIDQDILTKINNLRNRYTVILITDNMDCFERFTVPALKLRDFFDHVVSSYTEKASKGDDQGELFQKIAEGLGSNMASSILIDNSEKFCNLFEKRGGRSLFVTRDQSLGYWLDNL